MICRNCDKYKVILDFEKNLVNSSVNVSLDFIDSYIKENQSQTIVCDNCGANIISKDYYFEDDFIDFVEDTFYTLVAEEVSNNIAACEYCGHGVDMLALRHSIESFFDEPGDDPDKIYGDFHKSTEISYLIYDITGFDDKYVEKIVDYIVCPHCDPEFGGHSRGGFTLCDEVYTLDDIRDFDESFYGDIYSDIEKEINTVADTCTFEELANLKEKFLENQSFYHENPAFYKLYEFIDLLYKKEAWYVLPRTKPIFRTRPNVIGKMYTRDKMWEPPLDYSRQNRYNVSGMPVLYCSNHVNVLKLEVKTKVYQWHNYATFKVNKNFRLFKIIPAFGYKFKGFIEEKIPKNKENIEFKKQYIITTIVANIVKKWVMME